MNNKWFRLESFTGLDKDISDVGIKESKQSIENWCKENKKEHRKDIKKKLINEELICSYSRGLLELTVRNFTQEIANVKASENFDRYSDFLKQYDGSLNNYLLCNEIQILLSKLNRAFYGKNDTCDALHVIFIKDGDTIVSDDKIFNRLNKYIQSFDVMTTEEFLKSI